jgi:hypothetical protein
LGFLDSVQALFSKDSPCRRGSASSRRSGRPDDQHGYRGEHGIEDTRKALIEARHLGIHPYCITIDDEALDYLPHRYGVVSFSVVDRINRLPFKLSEIYTRRTWVIGFQGAWIWVQDKAEIRRHITHMASISNAVMRSRTGDMGAKNSGATGIPPPHPVNPCNDFAPRPV